MIYDMWCVSWCGGGIFRDCGVRWCVRLTGMMGLWWIWNSALRLGRDGRGA